MAEPRPLVSCIMPTCNRRSFVPLAIQYFLRQDYPERELLIVDDGTDPVADLVPAGDPRIRYIRMDGKRSLGAKRNLACREAQGEIILHWDDDDWYAPHRIRYQVDALLQDGADVCGLPALYFYSLATGEAYRYSYPANRKPWVSGSTLCYTKALWQRNPFPEIDVGEDAHFVWSRAGKRVLRLDDLSIHVAMIHEGNVSPKNVLDSWWKPAPVIEVSRILGADWEIYAQPRSEAAAAVMTATAHGMAVAQAEHLAAPEFLAANLGRDLPRMRRWEIPFALSQARLGENMAVLDCTINPAGFQELLLGLYPNTLYRHWSPIQRGAFVLPFGVPDGAFDRVVCINTLEHLLAPQRAALMQAMARCLKPGGLLIITTDWYFDSLWVMPEALRIGVVRADRSEVFGGWNRVDLSEWRSLAAGAGLEVLLMPERAPIEGEPGLYLNDPPYLHTSLGGVFAKGAFAAPVRRVVLSLLTWNTRSISLESVQAYIREARMLQRLGHEPHLCVCDNGSTDGTAEALKQVEQALGDLPHRFIYNAQNLGNAIARNQIIDYMLECGADYLLFMDGDIEVIPCSSVAMLRYMEGRGARLGCLGADSGGQTQHRERATPAIYSVENWRVDTVNYVAWTQYGMFRRAVFEDGVRFDVNGPFGQPGWGFEDNDLAFQIEQKGYVNQRFCGALYLHRAPRSSTRNLRADGIDPNVLCEQRKQYVIEKWKGVPAIDQGPLNLIRRIQVQL